MGLAQGVGSAGASVPDPQPPCGVGHPHVRLLKSPVETWKVPLQGPGLSLGEGNERPRG